MMGLICRPWKPYNKSVSFFDGFNCEITRCKSHVIVSSNGTAMINKSTYNGTATGFGTAIIFGTVTAMSQGGSEYATLLVGEGGRISVRQDYSGMLFIPVGTKNGTTTTFSSEYTIYTISVLGPDIVIAAGHNGSTGQISSATYFDSTSWTRRYSGTGILPYCSAISSAIMVVGGTRPGSSGGGVIFTSVDGLTWTEQYGYGTGTTKFIIMKMDYLYGYFIGWGHNQVNNTVIIFWSANGTTWYSKALDSVILDITDVFVYEKCNYLIAQTTSLGIRIYKIVISGSSLDLYISYIPNIPISRCFVYGTSPLTVLSKDGKTKQIMFY